MNWLVENWYIVVGVIAVLVCAGLAVYKFAGLPTKSQITKIKEWLLYAVTVAEKDLGSGTGQLKLRTVYDMFIDKFPVAAKLVAFETFSKWVDDALDNMKKMLAENPAIASVVEAKVDTKE